MALFFLCKPNAVVRYGACLLAVVTSLIVVDPGTAFVTKRPELRLLPQTRRVVVSTTRHFAVEKDDNNNQNNSEKNNGSSSSSSSSSTPWGLESLRARQQELAAEQTKLLQRWRSADCASGVAAILPDWVRRLSVNYPLVACGSASGTIYVTHLERNNNGEVIAQSSSSSPPATANDDDDEEEEEHKPKDLEPMLRLLYGAYDGGGTIAIAFMGTLICEAGRAGGVNLWRLDAAANNNSQQQQLISQGSIRAVSKNVLVTSLVLDEDESYLWLATSDGCVQGYSLDEDDGPLALRTQPDCAWKVSSPVLSMQVHSELGVAVVTTAAGSVEVIDLHDDDDSKEGRPFGSFLPPFDSSQRRSSHAYAVCATIVQHKKKDDDKDVAAGGDGDGKSGSTDDDEYSIVCGGNDGSLFLQPLEMIGQQVVDTKRPFQRRLVSLTPRHMEAVKVLASPAPGLLISGSMDGGMRVWDVGSTNSLKDPKDKNSMTVDDDEPRCLYQFVGYKVWLGSLWTDGRRIVSDGADNTVIVHNYDFSSKPTQEDQTSD